MVIKNTKELSTTPLRKDALAILEAGYASILTDGVVRRQVVRDGAHLRINDFKITLDDYERVIVIGIGKCAFDACSALEDILGEYLDEGIVLDVRGGTLKKLKSEIGTHPLPTEQNVKVAEDIVTLLEATTERDLVLTVISGGGSALLCLPRDISCMEEARIIDTLTQAGATIEEINTVRKHISRVKGGQFAQLAYPAQVVSLIFSDVPGDNLSVIASGPTVKDETTVADAEHVLATYNILQSCKIDGCHLVETPKDDTYFKRVHNIVLLSNQAAFDAMLHQARTLGYRAKIQTRRLEGEADRTGAFLALNATESNMCTLYGGETTVTVRNSKGKGGRNQEVVLGALPSLPDDVVLVAAASDGWDNSDVAGALGDTILRAQAEELGLDPVYYRDADRTYDFFDHVGGHIVTGRTGANISDIYFTLHA